MKRFIFAGGGIVLAAVAFAFALNSPPANGDYPVIEHAAPAKPAPTPGVAKPAPKPEAAPVFRYSTRTVCENGYCYEQRVAFAEGRPELIAIRYADGWRWEPVEEPVHEGVHLPGRPIERTAVVARAGGRVGLRAGRVGLRVGTAPARFILRRCRGC